MRLLRPISTTRRRGKFCRHRNTFVCEEQRSVECADCGAKLDPIDVLIQHMRHRERLMFEARFLQSDITRLKTELEVIKRDVRNGRARIRRNTPKADPPVAKNVIELADRVRPRR